MRLRGITDNKESEAWFIDNDGKRSWLVHEEVSDITVISKIVVSSPVS